MYAIWFMLAFIALSIIRTVRGPSIWDRFHSLSLISAKVLIIIVLFASYQRKSYLLDIAIVYALLGFIGTVFVALFLLERYKGDKT